MYGEDILFTGGRALVFVLAAAVIFQTQIISCLMVGGEIPRYRSVTDLLILFADSSRLGLDMGHLARRPQGSARF